MSKIIIEEDSLKTMERLLKAYIGICALDIAIKAEKKSIFCQLTIAGNNGQIEWPFVAKADKEGMEKERIVLKGSSLLSTISAMLMKDAAATLTINDADLVFSIGKSKLKIARLPEDELKGVIPNSVNNPSGEENDAIVATADVADDILGKIFNAVASLGNKNFPFSFLISPTEDKRGDLSVVAIAESGGMLSKTSFEVPLELSEGEKESETYKALNGVSFGLDLSQISVLKNLIGDSNTRFYIGGETIMVAFGALKAVFTTKFVSDKVPTAIKMADKVVEDNFDAEAKKVEIAKDQLISSINFVSANDTDKEPVVITATKKGLKVSKINGSEDEIEVTIPDGFELNMSYSGKLLLDSIKGLGKDLLISVGKGAMLLFKPNERSEAFSVLLPKNKD